MRLQKAKTEAVQFATVLGRQYGESRQWLGRLRHLTMTVAFTCGVVLLALPLHVAAACTYPGSGPVYMHLFWDPTGGDTFPSAQGWELVSTYNGRFVRGEAPANSLTTGGDGSRPFTPTVTATVGVPNTNQTNGGNAGDYASSSHTHNPPTYTVGADNNGDPSNPNVPAFRSLQLMRYAPTSGSCLPSTIPQGAIALFNTEVLPTGFTTYTSSNDKVVRINSSVATGGGDTVTNTVSNISGLGVDPNGATNAQPRLNLFANQPTSPASTHTHSAPSPNSFTTTPVSIVPPYVQPVLGKATIDIPTLSINITALFDGDPGPSWNILSNPGGSYHQKFIRPSTVVNLATGQGATTHTAPNRVVVSGPASTPYSDNTWRLGGGQLAEENHTHDITFSFGAVSNIPPYVNFVIAQKVSFVLNAYRWYVDSGATSVTDPWPAGASLDIAPDTVLPAVPAPYRPPNANVQTELRLRVQILVAGQPLPASGTSFKLQYRATSNNDCLSGTWTDVGAIGADWQYGSGGPVDGASLSLPSVFSRPASNVMQVFSKSVTGATVPNMANTGDLMEYDWLIQDTSAQSGTQYYFRVIEANGTPFGSYINPTTFKAECPGIVTKAGTEQQLRHGNFFLTNPSSTGTAEQGFEWAD